MKDISDAVMKEWADQIDLIRPESMPMTQILYTKIDRVRQERSAMQREVLKYLDTDLLCYFTDTPEELLRLQQKYWNPCLSWFSVQCGADLKTTQDLTALRQPQKIHDYLHQEISKMNDDEFTVFQIVTAVSGSVILALCFLQGHAKPDDVMQACFVEENYKSTLYNAILHGEDPMHEKKCISMKRDLDALDGYNRALKAFQAQS